MITLSRSRGIPGTAVQPCLGVAESKFSIDDIKQEPPGSKRIWEISARWGKDAGGEGPVVGMSVPGPAPLRVATMPTAPPSRGRPMHQLLPLFLSLQAAQAAPRDEPARPPT